MVEELGIGRTALRQVLAQLLAEGILEVRDRQGYFVKWVARTGAVVPEDAPLREKVEHIVKGIIGYEYEEPAIDAIMGLFAQHHCASCDMHSCGDLAPTMPGRWPIETLNPQTGKLWSAEERRAMGLDK